jgi:hypothetical protein
MLGVNSLVREKAGIAAAKQGILSMDIGASKDIDEWVLSLSANLSNLRPIPTNVKADSYSR